MTISNLGSHVGKSVGFLHCRDKDIVKLVEKVLRMAVGMTLILIPMDSMKGCAEYITSETLHPTNHEKGVTYMVEKARFS